MSWTRPRVQFSSPVPELSQKGRAYEVQKSTGRKFMTLVNPWPHLEVKWSKIKVTRPGRGNAVTKNQPYLRNGTAYKLQTWYTDGVRWHSSATCAVTSKMKDL